MPTTFRRIAALLVLTLLGTAVAVAQDFDLGGFGDGATISAPPFGNDPVRTDLRLSADGVAPGTTINLAVVFDIEKPYHIQTRRPELKILIPTEVKPTTLPPGVVAADFQWPEPEPLKVGRRRAGVGLLRGRGARLHEAARER